MDRRNRQPEETPRTSIDKMAEEIAAQEPEQDEQEQKFQPGELCSVDATDNRVEIADDDEEAEAKRTCIKHLCSRVAQRDMVSRRLEVRDAWKARYFYRGNQHLLDGPKGTLVTPSMVSLGGQSFDDHNDETNIYLGFGDILGAALTAALPAVRFEPEDPTNASDISASENAEKARQLIERNNDMLTVLADLSRYLYTDGRCVLEARHVLDGQRFGYSNPGVTEEQEEVAYLPEQGENPTPQESGQAGTGVPRGSEVITCYGVLESKVAVQSNCLADTSYLQISKEGDITKFKTEYPDKADEIKAGQSPTAESEYERLARTAIMMGMRPSGQNRDSMAHNATKQRTWMRPEFYTEEEDDDLRNWLYQEFPKGLMAVMVSQTLCEQRNESMDDHLTLIHARSGDGAHRPALGSPVIPIQEKLNDCVELTHESFMHLIPRVWVGSEIDVAALQDAERRPGQYLKAPKVTGKGTADLFFTEQQIEIAQGMIQYMQWLFGEAPQFLCGGSPALFGGDTQGNNTLGGITIQRDQALGRVGLTWRNIRGGYANLIRQAVQAAATYREETMTGTVPGQGKQMQKLAIDPNDLKGNIRCFPDQDDNFPESWVAKRAVWNNVIGMAAKNPLLAKVLSTARNMMLAKDKAGLPEMVIPGADSSEKQMGEIQILLQSAPEPNPALQQAQKKIQQAAIEAQQKGIPIPPEAAQQAQQQLAQIPQVISTVKLGKLDDHQSEMNEIETWARSSDGIRAAAEQPEGYENVMTHYDEHAAALKAKQGPPPPPKPPAESINYKDLDPTGKAQMAAQAGIHLDPNALQAEDQQDKVQELAAKAPKPPLIQ
jgi:hypothetical protein